MPDTENRPAGVGLAAAVLSLLICFGVVCLIGAVGALFLTHNRVVPQIPTVRIILSSFDLLLLLFLAWCAWTVVGLFRMRSWARLSMVAIGFLNFLVFAVFAGLLVRARYTPIILGMDAHPNPAMPFPLGMIILALAAVYGVVAVIGLWWIIYFNRRTVRVAFEAAKLNSLPPQV
jgi:hypothetical protein